MCWGRELGEGEGEDKYGFFSALIYETRSLSPQKCGPIRMNKTQTHKQTSMKTADTTTHR